MWILTSSYPQGHWNTSSQGHQSPLSRDPSAELNTDDHSVLIETLASWFPWVLILLTSFLYLWTFYVGLCCKLFFLWLSCQVAVSWERVLILLSLCIFPGTFQPYLLLKLFTHQRLSKFQHTFITDLCPEHHTHHPAARGHDILEAPWHITLPKSSQVISCFRTVMFKPFGFSLSDCWALRELFVHYSYAFLPQSFWKLKNVYAFISKKNYKPVTY